mgnify:FL=1
MNESVGKPEPIAVGRARIPDPPAFTPDSGPIVDAWFVETFHNIGLDTPSFNRFRAAADRLKARLAKKE